MTSTRNESVSPCQPSVDPIDLTFAEQVIKAEAAGVRGLLPVVRDPAFQPGGGDFFNVPRLQ